MAYYKVRREAQRFFVGATPVQLLSTGRTLYSTSETDDPASYRQLTEGTVVGGHVWLKTELGRSTVYTRAVLDNSAGGGSSLPSGGLILLPPTNSMPVGWVSTGSLELGGVTYQLITTQTIAVPPASGSGWTPPPASGPAITAALWIGHTTSTTATISVSSVVIGHDAVRFAARPVNGGAPVFSDQFTVDPVYRFAKGVITGLAAGVRYNVEVWSVEGQVAPTTGRMRTSPAGAARSFSFGAASCSTTASNALIYERIRDRAESGQFEFFQHMGDIHYRNISTNSPNLFQEALDEVFQQPRQAALWRALPMYYIYDDHDYSANNGHRLTASRPAAVATFRNRVPSPALPNTFAVPAAQSVYYSYIKGRFRFIVTDMRADRDTQATAEGPNKTMLGAQQKQWLKDEVVAARNAGQFIVWISPVPWNTGTLTGDDSWGGYTTERQELADYFIAQDVVNRMTIISGDMHALAWDDGTNSPGGIPVMQAAALDRDSSQKGGPYTIGPLNGGVGWGTFVSQYGVFDVTDTGGQTASIRFRGMNVNQSSGVETALIDVVRNLTLSATSTGGGTGGDTGGTTPPPTGNQYFTNFSQHVPGPLTAPWIHLASNPARFTFGTVEGQTVLQQAEQASGDVGAILTAISGDVCEFYSEGVTSTNNSSSLEWAFMSEGVSASGGLYRIDVNPVTNVLRLRRRDSGGHGTVTTATLAGDIVVNERVRIRARYNAGRIQIRCWPATATEHNTWDIDWTETLEIQPGPWRAGAYNSSDRPRPAYFAFGVGVNGAAAPTAPLT